jgi:hypothetical protein
LAGGGRGATKRGGWGNQIIIPFCEYAFEFLFSLFQNRAILLFDHSWIFAISLYMIPIGVIFFYSLFVSSKLIRQIQKITAARKENVMKYALARFLFNSNLSGF